MGIRSLRICWWLALLLLTLGPAASTQAADAVSGAAGSASISAPAEPGWSYPIGRPGASPGDGFLIRHGFTTENTWFNPGDWHTGEDWYAQTGETGGADVYAVAAGRVVYAGANYPGRVVIVEHAAGLRSMYGHLDPDLAVAEGQTVARGDRIGVVLQRADDVPSHLHFELRTFVTTAAVNGARPRYPYRCGPGCPPGPGYWPIAASELPAAMGWLNPTHGIARRGLGALPTRGSVRARAEVVVPAVPASQTTPVYAAIGADGSPRRQAGTLALSPGARLGLIEVWTGPDAPLASGADAYRLWYRVQLPDGGTGWVQAAVPSAGDTGSDGRPSSIVFNLLPLATAP